MLFTRLAARRTRTPASALALSVALASGAALAIAVPAHAQNRAEAPAANYSKGFIAAYTPVRALQDAPERDTAAMVAAIPALVAAAETPDDRYVAGSTVYTIGGFTNDRALQLRGAEMMIDSGKVPAEQIASVNRTAYQLSSVLDDYDRQRKYLGVIADSGQGYEAQLTDGTTRTLSADDLRLQIAETYFRQQQYDAGFDYIEGLVAQRSAAGQQFPQSWITRAFTVAYENEMQPKALELSRLNAQYFPSDATWGDAIAVALNSGNYQAAETLDLLRLARRVDAFNDERLYLEYIEAADPRRYPGEVIALIDQGFASGNLDRGNSFVVDARAQAAARVAADRAELPSVAREARAGNASARSLVAAGDVYLSYDQPAEAEEFYAKALPMAGVDTPLVMTRLGIAQFDQGKYAEAQATFARVEGTRQAIASLWNVYAAQKGG